MYSTVSENFKNECKQDVNQYKRIAKIHVVEDNIDITNDNALVDFTIEETAYSENTFIGNSVAKKLDLNIINDGTYNLENKEVEVYVGIDYEGDGSNTELVPYGNFIISKPTNEEVKNASNYVGYDYMIKTETPYVEDNIVYPMSLYNYLGAICTTLGLTLGNASIPNGNYQVLGNAYTNGESFRQVIEEIATCCGGFAVIGRDNKLYIRTLVHINDNEDDEITPGEYFEDFGTNNEYGPINRVAIALTYNVIGEDTIREDGDSIVRDGLTAIRVSDISFLNSEAQRELVIDNFWTQLHNLKYVPFSAEYYGYPYLDSGDIIKIKLPNNNYAYSYVFNHKFTYNGAFSGKIETLALSDIEKEYDYSPTAKSTIRNTELKVDKINGQITSIINEIGDRSDKQTSITQDIDSIELKIGDLEDLTLEVQGLNPIQLDNCLEGELIELRIFGNNTVFDGLFPEEDLYPSNELYPLGSSLLKIYTDNIYNDSASGWENFGSTVLITSERVVVNGKTTCFSIENNNYKIHGYVAYGEDGSVIGLPGPQGEYQTHVMDWESFGEEARKTVHSVSFEIERVDGGDISPDELPDIKPMIAFASEKPKYVKYNTQIIDLGITEPLRQYSNTIYDEVHYDANYLYDFEEEEEDTVINKCMLIRRVGVSQSGELYPLAQPIYQVLDIGSIMLAQGINYIDIEDGYTTNLYARYVQINDFTKVFATQYQMTSQILQLANSIQLLVSEKVGTDEIIAKINLAVENEQGIINIKSNLLTIDSDYFTLTADGHITSKSGTIGGWNIDASRLYKYRSGMRATTEPRGVVFYAGADPDTIQNTRFRVLNNGEVTGHLFHIEADVSGDTGIHIYDANKNLKAVYDARGFTLLEDGEFARFGKGYSNKVPKSIGFWLNDADGFFIQDSETVHKNLFEVRRSSYSAISLNTEMNKFLVWYTDNNADWHTAFWINNDGSGQATTSVYSKFNVWARTNVIKNQGADESEAVDSIYYSGSTRVLFSKRNGTITYIDTTTSDSNLKKNIKETEIKSALSLIDKIKHHSFDWKGEDRHQKIGYIANELYDLDDCLAEKVPQGENAEYEELYQFNSNNILALCTKAIQELHEENKQLKNKINELEKRLNKLDGGK